MAASYPSSAKSFTTKASNDVIEAAHVNDLQDEVTAVETGLLTGIAHAFGPDATANNRDLSSSASKWRDLFLSRNAAIGGTLVVTSAGPNALGGATTTYFGLNVTGAFVPTGGGGAQAGVNFGQTISPEAGQQGYGVIFGPTLNKAGSGTHSIFASVRVDPPVIGAAAGTVTDGATVYVVGPPASGATNLYAVIVAAGVSRFVGEVQAVGAVTNSGIITPAQITATQNDYNPSGLSTSRILRLTSDASRDVTGLTALPSGRRLLLWNAGTNNIVLKHQNAGSTAANRFACPLAADYTLGQFQGAELFYDTAAFGTGAWAFACK
jgi:hypothetical protein